MEHDRRKKKTYRNQVHQLGTEFPDKVIAKNP